MMTMTNSWSHSQNQLLTQNSNMYEESANVPSLSQFSERISLLQYSKCAEITNYQNPSSFHHQHNSMLANNNLVNNMVQTTGYRQREYMKKASPLHLPI